MALQIPLYSLALELFGRGWAVTLLLLAACAYSEISEGFGRMLQNQQQNHKKCEDDWLLDARHNDHDAVDPSKASSYMSAFSVWPSIQEVHRV